MASLTPDEIFSDRAISLARSAAGAIEESYQYLDEIKDDEMRQKVEEEIERILDVS